MLVLNKNILTIGGNRLEGGPLTPPTPPTPSVIQPDILPNESYSRDPTGYYGPGNGGNKLDYNTTYTINYPSGYTISFVTIFRYYGKNWNYEELYASQTAPNTIKISDYLTSSQWDVTSILYFVIYTTSSYKVIYEPITLSPVS